MFYFQLFFIFIVISFKLLIRKHLKMTMPLKIFFFEKLKNRKCFIIKKNYIFSEVIYENIVWVWYGLNMSFMY